MSHGRRAHKSAGAKGSGGMEMHTAKDNPQIGRRDKASSRRKEEGRRVGFGFGFGLGFGAGAGAGAGAGSAPTRHSPQGRPGEEGRTKRKNTSINRPSIADGAPAKPAAGGTGRRDRSAALPPQSRPVAALPRDFWSEESIPGSPARKKGPVAVSPPSKKARDSRVERNEQEEPTTSEKRILAALRPSHWQKSPAAKLQPIVSGRKHFKALASPAVLAAATRTPLRKNSNTSSKKTWTPPSPSSRGQKRGRTSEMDNTNRRAKISFLPSFLLKPALSGPDGTTDDVLETEAISGFSQEEETSPVSSAFARSNVPYRWKNAKKADSPWMRRLNSIRHNATYDLSRFRSDSNAPSSGHRVFLLGDPRRRARSQTDATICAVARTDGSTSKVVCLCFLHAHGPCQISTENEDPFLPFIPHFGWICFSRNAKEHVPLVVGTQIRLYNAVLLPCYENIKIPRSEKQLICQSIVVQTQLCEAYPASLPSLPGLGDILRSSESRSC